MKTQITPQPPKTQLTNIKKYGYQKSIKHLQEQQLSLVNRGNKKGALYL